MRTQRVSICCHKSLNQRLTLFCIDAWAMLTITRCDMRRVRRNSHTHDRMSSAHSTCCAYCAVLRYEGTHACMTMTNAQGARAPPINVVRSNDCEGDAQQNNDCDVCAMNPYVAYVRHVTLCVHRVCPITLCPCRKGAATMTTTFAVCVMRVIVTLQQNKCVIEHVNQSMMMGGDNRLIV